MSLELFIRFYGKDPPPPEFFRIDCDGIGLTTFVLRIAELSRAKKPFEVCHVGECVVDLS